MNTKRQDTYKGMKTLQCDLNKCTFYLEQNKNSEEN